jgi:hypothetical protein
MEGRAEVGTKSTTRVAEPTSLSERVARQMGAEFGRQPMMASEPKNQPQVLGEITAEARKGYPGSDAHEATKRYLSEHPDAWGRYRAAPPTAYVNDPATVKETPAPLTATKVERRFKDNPRARGHAQDVVNARVRAKMAGDPKLSFGEAASAVFAADPALYERYRYDAVSRF